MIEPLFALRDVDVPVGARTRVRARIEEELARASLPKRHVARYALAAAVMAAVIALVAWPRPPASHGIDVPAGTQMDFAVATGHSLVHGPAQVGLDAQGLSLASGRVDAQGKLRVRGPSCDVMVDGTAEVSVTNAKLTVRVFAGSVEIVPPAVTCEEIDLTPPSSTAAPKRTADGIAPTTRALSPPPEPTTPTPAVPESIAPTPPPVPPAPATMTPAVTSPRITAATPATKPSVSPGPSTPPSHVEPRASVAGSIPLAEQRIESVSPRPSPPPPALPPSSSAPAVSQAAPARVPAQTIASEELAAALAEYRTATALESSDPDAAVRAWRAWRAHRSNTALAHGADLRLLALLHGLHRDAEAAELAREFLQRYPESPRRADVERLLARPH